MSKNQNKILARLNSIEEVLKLLLVNDVLGCDEIDRMQENIIKNIEELLLPLDMKNPRLYCIEDKQYIFVDMEEDVLLSAIKINYKKAQEIIEDTKIVLVFEKVAAKMKKALEDSEIAFCIKGGEIRI